MYWINSHNVYSKVSRVHNYSFLNCSRQREKQRVNFFYSRHSQNSPSDKQLVLILQFRKYWRRNREFSTNASTVHWSEFSVNCWRRVIRNQWFFRVFSTKFYWSFCFSKSREFTVCKCGFWIVWCQWNFRN